MKATAQSGDKRVEYQSLCAPFESNADCVIIEAWRKLDKPDGEIKVRLGIKNDITGKVRVSSIGVPYPSESRWVRHK